MTKKLISWMLAALLCCGMTLCVAATSTNPDALFVIDGANLLSDSEEAALRARLQQISQAYSAQVAVGTVRDTQGSDIDSFMEYVYDANGYGGRYDSSGVLLLVCMEQREYRILSNGSANDAIGSDEIDAIGDAIVSDLSDGYYADAFATYADQCEYYLDGYLNGFPFEFGKTLLICLIIGLVVGLCVALVLRSQLKSVRRQPGANAYVKQGSMQITASHDLFLYRTVNRRKRETNSSARSGGSGSSRSVGGGRF